MHRLVYTFFTGIYSDILLCAGFRGTHRDSMMPQPSTAPEPEGWDPEEEDHSPCPQDLGDEEYSAGPDAASMEGAISKFMEGLQVQERSGFPQIHRLLSRLPVPVQKKSRSHWLTTKSTRGCGNLDAASPALGACPSSRLGRGRTPRAMHGTSGQPRQNGLARRLEPDSK